MRIKEMALIAALVASVVPAVAQQATTAQAEPAKKQVKTKLTQQQLDEAKAKLSMWLSESKTLKEDATNITKKIGELASSGKLPQDAAGVQTLQDLVNQLKGINDRLSLIERAIEDIMGYIEGQKESLPVLMNDVADLKKTKFSTYVQTQYRDSDLPGQNDGFRMRRVRLSATHQIDPKSSMKVSYDLASSQFGSTINEPTETTGQLKDAFLTYDIIPSDVNMGTSVIMGRMSIPLGYEIERSSSDREMPERAQYNLVMFPGERMTGAQIRHGLGANAMAYAGAFNALSINDPQARTVSGPPGNRLAGIAGVRYFNKQLNAGVSTLWGKRHVQRGTAPLVNPTNDRKFVYVDASYVGLIDPRLTVRGEWMQGEDRIPMAAATAGNDPRDMSGGHVQLSYNINRNNQLNVKWESFDPNEDVSSDKFTGFGTSYIHYFNPGVRLMVAHERIKDEARSTKQKYGITTFRMQYKF